MLAPRILILDDEPIIRMSLAAYLEDEGYQVLEAATAEHALQLLDQHDIALAIVDIRLPGIDGAEFIRYACNKDAALKFIIHTGSMEFRLDESLRRLGLRTSDIFCKPVKDLSGLAASIGQRLVYNVQFA